MANGGIIGVLEICDFGDAKGNEILGETSEEKTHERLVDRGETENGWIGGREYLSGAGGHSSHNADGIYETLEWCGIAKMNEGVGRKERGGTLPEELCEGYWGEGLDGRIWDVVVGGEWVVCVVCHRDGEESGGRGTGSGEGQVILV